MVKVDVGKTDYGREITFIYWNINIVGLTKNNNNFKEE